MYTHKIRSFILSIGLLGIASLVATTSAQAQSPEAQSSPSSTSDAGNYGNYRITSSVEVGYRFQSVNGDFAKYRSDLNYRAGVRLFDSTFLIERNSNANTFIDRALITASGWGSDPSGSVTASINKTGAFQFDANVRKVIYFNNLKNFDTKWSEQFPTGSQHQFNTRHNFGDFDFTAFPENEKYRFRIGYGFNKTEGPGTYTIRWPQFSSPTTTTRGDEFQVNSRNDNSAHDLRLGAEGKAAGFNWGINYGRRIFNDDLKFTVDAFSAGNSPLSNTASINSFYRQYPTEGNTDYISGFFQRTFERKLDLTGRIIYTDSQTNFLQADLGNGLSSASGSSIPQLIVDEDRVDVRGEAKRNQTRADLGLTYRASEMFRISNTFNFDQFGISGQSDFLEYLRSRTTAGVVRPNDFSNNTFWRLNKYHRYTNLIEADFQINRRFAFNAGYRYTHRDVEVGATDRNVRTGLFTFTEDEEFTNTTHSFIAGTKIRPTDNWTIFADFEHGEADTPFTRLSNGEFTNFRVRTMASLKNFTMSASFISKDNDIPGLSNCGCTVPATETIAKTKNRIFSATVDWTPVPEITFGSGYTYNHLDTNTDIIVPVGSPTVSPTTWFLGTSKYFMRDSYFNLDVTARPSKRLSFYASYRINDDSGQDIFAARPQDIFSSYPMRFQTPEARLTIKLNRRIDWNIGYQYYSYKETPIQNPTLFIVITGQPNVNQVYQAQNYTAHLPYTSLRIYFGGDR